jgi:RecB family endonuclease NucS
MARVKSRSLEELTEAMKDSGNWVGLLTHFDYERALSGYIAAYPHRLEDGLLPHPNERIRERIFGDKTRLDVLLTDRADIPIIVECKQGSPTIHNLEQIRHYMKLLEAETGVKPRGILVHGGARKLSPQVVAAAREQPEVEVVQYTLDVDFASCG